MRGTFPLLILAAAGSLYATAGLAGNCPGPRAPSSFPDPSTATEQDIIAAQQSVKQYLTEMEAVLKCTDSVRNTDSHDAAVDDMQKIAAQFNIVLHAYRSKKKT